MRKDQSDDAGVQTREEGERWLRACMQTGQDWTRIAMQMKERIGSPLSLCPRMCPVLRQRIKSRTTRSCSLDFTFVCWIDGLFSQKSINYRMGWTKARTALPSRVGTERVGNGNCVSRLCGGREFCCLHTSLFICLFVCGCLLRNSSSRLHCARWKQKGENMYMEMAWNFI